MRVFLPSNQGLYQGFKPLNVQKITADLIPLHRLSYILTLLVYYGFLLNAKISLSIRFFPLEPFYRVICCKGVSSLRSLISQASCLFLLFALFLTDMHAFKLWRSEIVSLSSETALISVRSFQNKGHQNRTDSDIFTFLRLEIQDWR